MSDSNEEQSLPDTLEEFVEAADRKDKLVCDTCGEPVERQYIQDGECVGCRKGPGIHATREVSDD